MEQQAQGHIPSEGQSQSLKPRLYCPTAAVCHLTGQPGTQSDTVHAVEDDIYFLKIKIHP